MQNITIKAYTYEELDEAAKEKVLESMYDLNVDYDWWEFAYDYIREAGLILGIDVKVEGFDLDRGSYITLNGSYSYQKGAVAAIRAEYGQDHDLVEIAEELQKAQRPMFYQACADLSPIRGYGGGTRINVDPYGDMYNDDYIVDNAHTIEEPLRDFVNWALSVLESEYEYLTSREAIEESIIANEYLFTENGNRSVYL